MRLTEHFQNILNIPPPDEETDIQDAQEDLEINGDTPKEEIFATIKSLKNGKSPGQDNLNSELFKVDPETAASILTHVFTAVWQEGRIPNEQKCDNQDPKERSIK